MSAINKVLWTSGWDSTFRVIELYIKGATIQPIYVIDDNRASSKKELKTIELLKKIIESKYNNTGGKLLELIVIKRKDIPKIPLLKLAYKVLKSRQRLGKQYYWLALLAKDYKELELSINKNDLFDFFLENKIITINDEILGKNWIIDPKKTDYYTRQIFENMRFPLINLTKVEMKKIAVENDFIDIMNQTWFCHNSTVKPCGECNPCKQHIKDNMAYRLD
jgi:7-cyano-7-deazaguanine synthase